MFHLNKQSALATVNPDRTLDDYEMRLFREGLTGGYCPTSGGGVSLETCLSERTPNLFFLKYGGIENLCVGGEMLPPWGGHPIPIKTAPRAATGPDLRRLFIGSREIFGRFKKVTLRVFPIPEMAEWGFVFYDHEEEALQMVKKMMGNFIRPQFMTFLDENETSDVMKELGLPSEDRATLAMKLSGLARMVAAEKDALVTLYEEQENPFFWTGPTDLNPKCDQLLLTTGHWERFLNVCGPLISEGNRVTFSKAEEELKNFFTEVTA